MFDLNEIYNLYDAYIEKVADLNRKKKVTDGLFGITKGPKDDPCHDQFIETMEKEIAAFSASNPDSAQIGELLEYMYKIPLKHRDNSMVYWMFLALHTLVSDLIPGLSREDAQRLYADYQKQYPKAERLPAQKKTLKALKAIL